MKILLKITMAAAIILLSACNKEKDSDKNPNPDPTPAGQYFIKFKIDGAQQVFDIQNSLTGIIGQSGPQHAMAVDGMAQSGASVNILVFDDKEINTGIYTDFEVFPTFQRGVVISWTDEDGYTYNTTLGTKIGSVNITSITTTEMRGTFDGDLVDLTTFEEVTLTEGEFYVKRIN